MFGPRRTKTRPQPSLSSLRHALPARKFVLLMVTSSANVLTRASTQKYPRFIFVVHARRLESWTLHCALVYATSCLLCPHCSDSCAGKDSRNCKKLICMAGCEEAPKNSERCKCRQYCCCRDCKPFRPNANKKIGNCTTCNVLLCVDCQYETCEICEEKVCEDHAVADSNAYNEEYFHNEDYDETGRSYFCEKCDNERHHQGDDSHW